MNEYLVIGMLAAVVALGYLVFKLTHVAAFVKTELSETVPAAWNHAVMRTRDVMTLGAHHVHEDQTIREAAKRLAHASDGAVPIYGRNRQFKGIITDREIVNVVAVSRDPAVVRVRDIAHPKPISIGADCDVESALRVMAEHHWRLLPVTEAHRIVGMVSQRDLARSLPKDRLGECLDAIVA